MWWQATRAPEPGGGERLAFVDAGQPMSFADVLDGWAHDAGFRDITLAALAATDMPAFFWEMPPLRAATRDAPYECVLLPAPGLARATPDRTAFADRFAGQPDRDAIACPNLGGDATLVVPRPVADDAAYGHLAAFVRSAPAAQQHELLRILALTAMAKIGDAPLWLSTSGLGVPWLHLRLDTRPKYYQCGRYRTGT